MKPLRYILGTLLALIALNALGGGIYGLSAVDIPTEWLAGSPFGQWRNGSNVATAAGIIVLGWLAIQMAVIGYVSWMQPATAVTAVVIVLLARLLLVAERSEHGARIHACAR